ncbi:hypothetical protein L248_2421 [Schleiferilactobacillus shenzhenensis LY-73]|uniref:Uncharacterized protein n=1 Tax=Schleiferilactobacillus shenzhenensis LY-73 TaxID=1231336 RepID=U4TQL7_9LACO|nr:hypothetical protein L248_2421 [Schleiferilactobacillus shenzhenensis LY-73]
MKKKVSSRQESVMIAVRMVFVKCTFYLLVDASVVNTLFETFTNS